MVLESGGGIYVIEAIFSIVCDGVAVCAQREMGHQSTHDFSLRLLFCFGRIVVYTVCL